ncbi:MAG: hypothetical protein AAF988_05855, partial [Pseudomonadota bacterium]
EFSGEERAYFSAFVNHLPFSNEQKATFEKDYSEPQNVFDLLKEINEHKYRDNVLDFGLIMAYKDGVLDTTEDDILKGLKSEIIDEKRLDEIKTMVREETRHEMNLHDIQIDSHRPNTRVFKVIPVFQFIDEVMLALGIDLMRD